MRREENQVPEMQFVGSDLSAHSAHFLSAARQCKAQHLAEQVLHQPAAVKSGVRRTTAVRVLNADQS